MRMHPGAAIEAFGQPWLFTAEALEALKEIWVGTPATLKTLAINVSPRDGFEDGDRYQINYYGVNLLIRALGGMLIVDALDGTA